MSELSKPVANLPPEQQAIRAKCFHPSGTFVEFAKEEVEQSIPERFEKIVRLYPDRIAIKLGDQTLTYTELNRQANRLARSIVEQQGDPAEPIAHEAAQPTEEDGGGNDAQDLTCAYHFVDLATLCRGVALYRKISEPTP